MDDTLENPDVGVLGIEICGIPGRICVGDYVLLSSKKYIAVVDLLSFVPAKKSHKKQPKRPKGVPAYIATSSAGPGDWYIRGRWVYKAEDLPKQGLVAALGRDIRKNEVFPSMDFCVCSVSNIVGKVQVVNGNDGDSSSQHDNSGSSKGRVFVYYNVMMEDGVLVPVDDALAERVVSRVDVGEINANTLEKIKAEPAPSLPASIMEHGDQDFEWSESDSDENKDTEPPQHSGGSNSVSGKDSAAGNSSKRSTKPSDEAVSTSSASATGRTGKKRERDESEVTTVAEPKSVRANVGDVKTNNVSNDTEVPPILVKPKKAPVPVIKSADIGIILAKENGIDQFRWIGRPTRGTEDGPDMIVYGGFERNNTSYHAGDFFLSPWPAVLGPERFAGKQCVARILCCFQRLIDNKCFVNVEWFVMPDVVTKTTGAESVEGEVYPTMVFADVSVADIGVKCRVVHATEIGSVTAYAQKQDHYWWRRWYDVHSRSVSDAKIVGSPNTSLAAVFAQRRTSAEIF